MPSTTTAPKRVTRKPAEQKAATPKKRASKADVQTQAPAVAPEGDLKTKTKAPAATKPAGSGRGKSGQQQGADTSMNPTGKQGGTAGKADTGPIYAGAKQVLIEEVPMPSRIGRPRQEEEYPFLALKPSVMQGKAIMGPSFFIPNSDNAERHVTAARKRHKGITFWTRKVMGQINGQGPEVPGIRVWRAGDGFKA